MKSYVSMSPTAAASFNVQELFAREAGDGAIALLELGMAQMSGGEVSDDFRVLFYPLMPEQDANEVIKEVKRGTCASNWLLHLRKRHDIAP